MSAPSYNFAYLDEQTKRMIRRADPEGDRRSRAIRCRSRAVKCRCLMVGAPAGSQVTAVGSWSAMMSEGHRSGLGRHHKCGFDPASSSRRTAGVKTTDTRPRKRP